jgi:protein-S-isoprenylcysteine O-methyltransferase Ste14
MAEAARVSAVLRKRHFIDSHKAATAPIVFLMLAGFGQWENPTAWVYLALHGTYGFLWLLKSRVFPDKQWEAEATLGNGLYIWGALSLYFVAPWLLMARGVQAPPWYLAACVSMYGFGVFFHFGADMQKHTSLRLRPGQLVDDGLLARCRNVNYFGELLIYLGFGLLAMHPLPIAILLLVVLVGWLPNMRAKDRSLSRYAGFDDYRRRSRLLIPFLY